MIIQIFSIIFPVVAIVLVGYFYASKYQPNMDTANNINMNIFLPALMFSVLSKESFQIQNYQMLALSGVLVVLGSGVIAWIVAKALNINIKTFVPPMMFNNTGNVGLPIAVLAFGEIALGAAVVLFAIEMLLHFTFGAYILSKNTNFISIFKSPILIATLLGLFAKPGVMAKEVDAAARGVITEAGYGDYFVHRTGHGLGIDIHEPPYITATSEVVLDEGMVFSIEPGIYLQGRFGVRLEEIVILRSNGPEILSELSRKTNFIS